MTALRRQILRHRGLAAWLFALTLALKLLIPGGYMPTVHDGRITIAVCSGTSTTPMVMTIPGFADRDDAPQDQAKPDQPCAFAGLSLPSLAAADPIVLAAAIAFIVATVFRMATPVRAATRAHLRPPPRGPPLLS